MSYILDALRRAEADRARGAVPGLHANNMPADGEPAARNFNPLIWAAGVVSTLLVAVVAILLFAPWRSAPATQPVTAAVQSPPADALQPTAATPAAAPAPAMASALVPAPVTALTSASAAALTSPPAPQMPSLGGPASPRTASPGPQARMPAAQQGSPSSPPAGRTQAPVEHYGAPVAPPAAVANVDDLPADVRAQLPRLTVGGAIYSPASADRMLILNGQIYHEGDQPAADTVLEQIQLKSAVLNYRGQRYRIFY